MNRTFVLFTMGKLTLQKGSLVCCDAPVWPLTLPHIDRLWIDISGVRQTVFQQARGQWTVGPLQPVPVVGGGPPHPEAGGHLA